MLKLSYADFEKLPCLIDGYEVVRLITPTLAVKISYGMTLERINGLSQKYIEDCAFPLEFCEIAEQTFLYTMPKIEGQNLAIYPFRDLYHLTEVFEKTLFKMKEFHNNDVYPADIHEGNLIYTKNNKIGFIDLDEAGFDDIVPVHHLWHQENLKRVYELPLESSQKYRLINKMQLLHMFLSACRTGMCHLDYKKTLQELGKLDDETCLYFKALLAYPEMICDDDYLEDSIRVLRKNKNLIYHN